MIQIRSLDPNEFPKNADMDRSEHVPLGYRFHNGQLEAEKVDWHIPRWTQDGVGEFNLGERIEALKAKVQSGAEVFGAFDEDTLVGYAVLRERISKTMAQLADLFVSRNYRRRGVATRLVSEVMNVAREGGAEKWYVSAVPSKSAVAFYLKCGFEPTHDLHPE
jgi:GNAT superfamily N-acetyltransferase